MIEVSGLCLSVFVTSDQRNADLHPFFMFACVHDLRPYKRFGHVGKISWLLGLNHYEATDKASCPRTQNCNSGESRPPDEKSYSKLIFLTSHLKHMLWVLKRTTSMSRFF